MTEIALPTWLCCPECHSPLKEEERSVVCQSRGARHGYNIEDGIILFNPGIGYGKYDTEFAAYYAGVMAYGHELLHLGATEGLYRTVMDLSTELLPNCRGSLILDLGCGVGRITRDLARRSPDRTVIGLDASLPMLREAHQFAKVSGVVSVDLSARGFGRIGPARTEALNNVILLQGDAARTPFVGSAFAFVTSVNLIDRVPDPVATLREIGRVLRPGGNCVITSPLNWMPGDDCERASELWHRFPSRDEVIEALDAVPLHVDQWFDGLPYREHIDIRGNVGEWNTLIIVCSKPTED